MLDTVKRPIWAIERLLQHGYLEKTRCRMYDAPKLACSTEVESRMPGFRRYFERSASCSARYDLWGVSTMYVALSLCRSDVLFRTVQCSAEHGLLMNELIVPSLPGMTKVAVGQLAPSPSTCTLWTIVAGHPLGRRACGFRYLKSFQSTLE